ncbi:hypothetical protein DOY81_013133 [Sarcophaga bullata]|nr:hypothetical protein DOY81_013133 [Sarcophaga bullata]
MKYRGSDKVLETNIKTFIHQLKQTPFHHCHHHPSPLISIASPPSSPIPATSSPSPPITAA